MCDNVPNRTYEDIRHTFWPPPARDLNKKRRNLDTYQVCNLVMPTFAAIIVFSYFAALIILVVAGLFLFFKGGGV